MAIQNGQLTNADEVMNAFGAMFKNWSYLLFDADYEGLDASLNGGNTITFPNIKFNTFKNTNSTGIDTTNTTAIYEGIDSTTDKKIVFAKLVDNFDDASINTNIWTSATTGSGSRLAVGDGSVTAGNAGTGSVSTASLIANGASATNYSTGSGNKVIYMKATFSNSIEAGGSGTTLSRVELSNGTTHVTLRQYSNTGALTSSGATEFIKVVVNDSASTVDVYINGTLVSDNLSIAAIANWYIRIYADANCGGSGGCTASLSLSYLSHLLGDSATCDFVSDATTATSTITNAILVVNEKTDQSTGIAHTYYLSANNGSNYESVTPNQIHRFTNTGTQLKVKVTATTTSSITATTEDSASELYEYAVIYNLY